MSVPEDVRTELRTRLFSIADEICWINMSAIAKSKQYENWTRQPEIGGILGRFMDNGKIRVYIKDTLLKDYVHERLADDKRPLRVAGVAEHINVVQQYTKPHGRRLVDGKIICWGKADEWKTILMALHERAFVSSQFKAYAAVLMYADGRFHETSFREMVQAAAHKLSIENVVWLNS